MSGSPVKSSCTQTDSLSSYLFFWSLGLNKQKKTCPRLWLWLFNQFLISNYKKAHFLSESSFDSFQVLRWLWKALCSLWSCTLQGQRLSLHWTISLKRKHFEQKLQQQLGEWRIWHTEPSVIERSKTGSVICKDKLQNENENVLLWGMKNEM